MDQEYIPLWIKYAEFETRNENLSSARNIWDRATTILPRIDQFWLKYVEMEILLQDYHRARDVFERWMRWSPSPKAWNSYLRMERRFHGEESYNRVRGIFQRYLQVHPTVQTWVKYALWEEQTVHDIDRARQVYDQCIAHLESYREVVGPNEPVAPLSSFPPGTTEAQAAAAEDRAYVEFAQFEVRMLEFERARAIYQYAIRKVPGERAEAIYRKYAQFEKQHGDRQGIEDVVVNKRRFLYEEVCNGVSCHRAPRTSEANNC